MSNGGAGAGVVMAGVDARLGAADEEDEGCGVLRLMVSCLGSFFTSGFFSAFGSLEVEAMGVAGVEVRRCPRRSVTSSRVLSRMGDPVDRAGLGIRLWTRLWGCEVGREAGRDEGFLDAMRAAWRAGGRLGSRGAGAGGFAIFARIRTSCSLVVRSLGAMPSRVSRVSLNVCDQWGHGCSSQ